MSNDNLEHLSEEEQEHIRIVRAAKAVQLGMKWHTNEQIRLATIAEKRRKRDERFIFNVGILIVIVFMIFVFKDPDTFFPIFIFISICGAIYYAWRIFKAILFM